MNAGISKLACLGTLVVAAIFPDAEAGTLTVRRPGGYAGATGGGEYNVIPSDALLLSAYSPKTLLKIDGILPGYNYTPGPGREASATSLQIALWALENETDTNGNPWDTQMGGNTFFDAAVGRFGSLADARLDNAGLFGVEVMIVSTGTASTLELWQDLLVRTGDGGAVRTPDSGSAVALLCADWSVVTLLRRHSHPSGISGSPQN